MGVAMRWTLVQSSRLECRQAAIPRSYFSPFAFTDYQLFLLCINDTECNSPSHFHCSHNITNSPFPTFVRPLSLQLYIHLDECMHTYVSAFLSFPLRNPLQVVAPRDGHAANVANREQLSYNGINIP